MNGKDETLILFEDIEELEQRQDLSVLKAKVLTDTKLDPRRARVEAIKAQVHAGEYQVNTEELASTLIKKLKL